jgi:hypothetical protein
VASGVIWRMQREGERLEAVVAATESGACELCYLRNGTILKRLWLAAGRGLTAIEDALAWRDSLKDAGWQECAGH